MSDKKSFLDKYPMPLLNLLVTPIIFKEGVLADRDLPSPGMSHLKDLCEYGNYSYGALRTAMTRARKKGLLGVFMDENGNKRYRLTETQLNVSSVVVENRSEINTFSLAIFTFQASDTKQRYRAREILGYFGFRKIAQNVYIRRRITGRHLEESINREGFQSNIFVFECEDPGIQAFKDKLYAQFNVPETTKKLQEFKTDLVRFLDPKLDKMEFARRIFYAGPVQHQLCFEDEPPLPVSYFPENYPIDEIVAFFGELIKVHTEALVEYYMALESGNQEL
jgi:DNA-binding transcriptional regulator PaaX